MIKSSIIIPAFNQDPAYLRAALLSAKHQTLKCEIIVVDDGSKPRQEDTVFEIMEGYTDAGIPCKYVWQENKGVAGALNRGLEEAEGEYIQWLPSDDLFHRDKTHYQTTYLPSAEFSVSYCSYEEGVPVSANTWPAAQYPDREKLFEALKQHCFINAATLMFHRSVLDEVGNFNEDICHCQDYEFILRLAEKYNFHALNIPLVRRRIHAGQMLRTLKDETERKKKENDMKYIRERYGANGYVWVPDQKDNPAA